MVWERGERNRYQDPTCFKKPERQPGHGERRTDAEGQGKRHIYADDTDSHSANVAAERQELSVHSLGIG